MIDTSNYYTEDTAYTYLEPTETEVQYDEVLTQEITDTQYYEYFNEEKHNAYMEEFDLYGAETKEEFSNWLDTQLETHNINMETMFVSMKEECFAAAAEQWGFMPEVCDEDLCRTEIWDGLILDLESLFTDSITRVKKTLGAQYDRTAQAFEDAWQRARECDHGCGYDYCMEQTIVYENTVNRITEIESRIHELMTELDTDIVITQEIITDCPQDVELFEYTHYSVTYE